MHRGVSTAYMYTEFTAYNTCTCVHTLHLNMELYNKQALKTAIYLITKMSHMTQGFEVILTSFSSDKCNRQLKFQVINVHVTDSVKMTLKSCAISLIFVIKCISKHFLLRIIIIIIIIIIVIIILLLLILLLLLLLLLLLSLLLLL